MTRVTDPYPAAAHEYVESFVPEDKALLAARERAVELGVTPVAPPTGATLRLLAAVGQARSVVEVGTGTGVSGLWLLDGMRADGVLTTIDIEAEYQRAARQAFAEAGYRPSRTRVITGHGLNVLPRLADAAYDLIFMDADPNDYRDAIDQALRLLRPGGVLAINDVLAGRITDPTACDASTLAMREAVRAIRTNDEWLPTLVPSGAGLLCAVKRG